MNPARTSTPLVRTLLASTRFVTIAAVLITAGTTRADALILRQGVAAGEGCETVDNGPTDFAVGVSIDPRTTANRFRPVGDGQLSSVVFRFFETTAEADIGPTIRWFLYADGAGAPGVLIADGTGDNFIVTPAAGSDQFEASFDLDAPPDVAGGAAYWLGLNAPDATFGEGVGWVRSTNPLPDSAVAIRFPGGEWINLAVDGLSFSAEICPAPCPNEIDNGPTDFGVGVSIDPRTTANRFECDADGSLDSVIFRFFETTAEADIGPTIRWFVYADGPGEPGALIADGVGHNFLVTPAAGTEQFEASFDLDARPLLSGGVAYWLGLNAPDATFGPGVGWVRSTNPLPGSAVRWMFPGQGWAGSTLDGLSFSMVKACPCPVDLDGSRAIDFGDILTILSAWGNAGGPEDLDMSGFVDFGDLLVVLGAWGPCP